MKKILTLSIALILVAGIVSMAKSTDIDSDTGYGSSTAYPKDRHIVKTSTGTIVVLYKRGSLPMGIRAKKSTDNGATWTKLDNTPTGSTSIGPTGDFSICLDADDNIYVAYEDGNDIYFKKLTYSVSGGTWTVGTRKCVEDNDGAEEVAYPSIIRRESDGYIWVSFGYGLEEGDARLRSKYSTDEFKDSNIYSDITSSQSGAYAYRYLSALVIRDDNPFVVYADTYGQDEFMWSYWNVSAWETPVAITPDEPNFDDGDFSVTVIGSNVHFVYNEKAAGIKHRYYNGTSWSDPATTLSTDTDDKNVSLTTDDSDLWCFISEYVGVNSYNIKYKMWSGPTPGDWDSSWTPVIEDNAKNLYSTTPLSTTEYIPLAWTEGTSPFEVKFDSSVVVVVATTYTWTDVGSDGVWTNPSNWSGGTGYPDDKNDKAIINMSPRGINTGAARTLGELVLGSGYTGTLTLGGNLTLDSSGPFGANLTIGSGTTLNLAGNNLSGAASFTNNGTLKLKGDETTNIPPARGTPSTVEYTATSDTRAIKNWDYHHLKINGSGGTFTVGAGETLEGNLTIAAGTFNLNAQTVNVKGNFLKSGGTLSMQTTDKLDIAGNFTVTGGAVDIPANAAYIYIGGNINISGDNSFNPVSGRYFMDHGGNANVSIIGANNDLGYDSPYTACFYVSKANSTDKVTLLTDMKSTHFFHEKGIFDVNGKNASFSGVYYGDGNAKLQMSSGTFRCGRNEYTSSTYSVWYCPLGWTENISGGTITVYGGKHATYGTAYFANGSEFTPTGGTFQLVGTDASSIYIAEEHDADFNFYNLTIGDGTNAKTVDMDASSYPLDVNGNLTVNTNATFNTIGKAVDVASSVDIDGTFNANSSTITVAGNWDSSAPGVFNRGTSTVDLTGNGNLTTTGAWNPHFCNLKVAATGKTTTILSHIGVTDTLTLGNATGKLTDGAGDFIVILMKNSGAPLSHGGAKIELDRLVYRPTDGTVTVTGGNYGSLTYLELYGTDSGATFNLGGSVTVTGTFWLVAANGKSGVVCDTQNYDITASTGLMFGYNTAYGTTTLNCGTSTIDIGTDGLYVYANGGSHTLNLSSATVTCAGNWTLSDGSGSITQIPGTSTVTFDSNAAGRAITSNGQSFADVVFDSQLNTGEWTLQDAFTCKNLQVVDKKLTDGDQTVTVNGDIDIVDVSSQNLDSTGTWIQGANGNISNPYWYTNRFYRLQIASGVTSTRTAASSVLTRKLILGANATLGGTGTLGIALTTDNDFIDMGTNSSIIDGSISITPNGSLTQKAINTSVPVGIWWVNNASIQMTGDWTTGNLTIFGASTSQSEGDAMLLDTNGNNLTVNGSLTLGRNTGTGYYGKIIFSTGTHTITVNVRVGPNNPGTHGYFDLGSADISIGGNVDFSSATVTPGTSTVTLNGSGAQTVTSDGESFYHLEIENTDTSVQLQDAADIDGGLNVTTGTLDLNNYDITISSDVYISGSGSLTCSSGEQITVGGNWSASSGATFTAANSTTTFNGNGSFNILSSGTTFYNLAFSNNVSTWTLTDALYLDGDFTITNSSGNVNSNSKNLTIAGDFTVNGGKFTAGASASTITVAGDWDTSVSANAFIYGTSTVDLTGTGTVNVYGTTWSSSFEFLNLKCAAAGEFTTLVHHVGVRGYLELGSGTLSGPGYAMAVIALGTPFVHGGAAITLGNFIYWTLYSGIITVTGGDYGTVGSLILYPSGPDRTYKFGGDITVKGDSTLQLVTGNHTGNVVNTEGCDLTVNRILFGASWGTGGFTVNCGTSTIDIGTNGLDMANNGGSSHILNLSSATVTCEGDWQLVDGSGSIDQNWGTSTVTFDGPGTSTSTLTGSTTGSTTFYVLISTTTGKNVKFTSDIVIGVTNHLNFENITLRSTLDGATWYLNLDPSATQDVFNVNVKDSNASGGQTIIAPGSTDLGNNTNWVFDDSIITWDGSESTNWNTAANWNLDMVPLSTQTVIIPNVTTNNPQLTLDVIIASMTIQTGGQLSLNNYDITVSSDVYISGSLLCSNTEQITIGGNWSAYSGATVTASSSTVTFNGSGSFNILSSGTTFYNLLFNNSGGTWALSDALYVKNDFTQSNGTFDTNSSGNYPVTIGDDITISGGTFYARVSTITLTGSNSAGSANWDSYGGLFTYGTSTVDLKETGTIKGSDTSPYARPFYNLTCAYPGKTTTITTWIGVSGFLSVKGGTLTTSGSQKVYLRKTSCTPISIVNESIISVYRLLFDGPQTVPEYNYDSTLGVWSNGEVTQLGDITCTGLRVDGDGFGNRSPTWNTAGYSLTINGGLLFGWTSGDPTGTQTFTANGSTITITGNVTLNHPNAQLNLDTSNMRVAGNWTITSGNVSPGTSSVTFYGTGTSTSTLTGSTTFYVLISTTTGKNVEFSSDTITGVTGHLNFENITLHSNTNGATWYLNLTDTQDVHHVNVQDSNADGGNTIYAGCSTDSGNNTNWVFDDSILTWDGDVNTDWNEAENWNFSIVPLSTHTVIIPDVTTNDPQLTSAVTIASMTIQTDGQLSLNNYDITVSSDIYISGSLLCSNTEQITIGGNWSAYSGATVTASSSTVTFNSNDTGKTITSANQSFANVVFDSENDTGGWTLQDALTCDSSLQIVDGTLTDNTQTVTVNGNIIIANTSGILTSTGLWIQGADGNISNPKWHDNKFNTLQIDDYVTSTRTENVLTRKLILGTDATLTATQSTKNIVLIFPTVNDFIDMGSGSSIIEGIIQITLSDGSTLTQKAINTSVTVGIVLASTATIQMTGDWTTGNLDIFGAGTSDTEGEAMVLDTNGNNLTVNGNLTLGIEEGPCYGKILFSSGTHSITGNVDVNSVPTWGYFYLGSADISIGGNCDFSRATVTPGTSTVTLNGSSGTQTVTSDGESFYHLEIENTDTSVQLQDAADIDGGLTISTGTLDLNSYDITISSDVSISGSGSLTCSSGEQITVGGNWSADSGATFTASSSTVTFNGSGSFNILSSGTTFYNLVFNNSGGTWTLTDALYADGDFTVTNSQNISSNNKDVTIAGDFAVNGGQFTAGASAIAVGGDWDTSVSANAFTYDTSTVDLTGTGNLKTTGGEDSHFYNLSVSAANKTTTLQSHVAVADILTIGSGILTDGGSSLYVFLNKNSETPLSLDSDATITLLGIVYRPLDGTVTVTGGDYGTLHLTLYPGLSNATFNLGGDVTVNGFFRLFANNGQSGVVCDTKDYELTATGLLFGALGAAGSTTFNCKTSTIDIGTIGLNMANDGGSHTLNLSSATVTCEGDWWLVDGTGSIDQNWGTSTVTFDGPGTSTSTLTGSTTGSTTFYVLISTTTGKNVKVSSGNEINVTNHLNFENITLHSTLDGATWYLNLSGTQDVSGVDVRDSNASGSADTILDFDCPDIESCYYGNNTNWDFGPPGAITDLTGLYNSGTGDVTLSWSTPGDDGWIGTLLNVPNESKYIIDYSTYSIAWSTTTYDVEIPTHSVTPYTQVSHTITGLTGGSTYYFRIWTADEIPLWSDLSNGCTVWVNPIISISISTDTYNFGEVPLGASTHTVSIITVTNDGNIKETYSLKVSSVTLYDNSPSLWKSTDTTTGYNRFISYAIFHGTDVASGYFELNDAVVDENRSSTSERYTYEGGSPPYKQTGKDVPAGEVRKIWFRLDMPTKTTTGKKEKIRVTVTAGPE